MIKIIDSSNSLEWNKQVKGMLHNDFYFFNGYYSDQVGGNSAILISFSYNEFKILLPLIIRKIPNSRYFDSTSVYGYAGPLKSHDNIPVDIIERFKLELTKYFIDNNIISVFSRLHSLFEQEELLIGLGDVVSLSATISIDLSLPLDEQRKQYRKGVKSDLSRLRKRDLVVFEDNNKDYIDEFIEIYNENMQRVDADESYFFSRSYYENLFNKEDIDTRLFFVKDGEKFIAASIFIFTDNIIQYHLSGTKSNSLQNSPVRLLIDYIRILGTEQGFKFFHLGGGVGSKEDALFNFKAGFSKQRHSFKVWKFIVDKIKYNETLKFKGILVDDGFFPLYRTKTD